jgi:hypothetical protein
MVAATFPPMLGPAGAIVSQAQYQVRGGLLEALMPPGKPTRRSAGGDHTRKAVPLLIGWEAVETAALWKGGGTQQQSPHLSTGLGKLSAKDAPSFPQFPPLLLRVI